MIEKKFEVTEKLLNAVVAYLAKHPYEQTFQLIQALQKEVEPQIKPSEPVAG